MRIVHLSDLHLGFRQYQRLTAAGINQRETDVARSFTRAVDRVIALAPDFVLIAGDVFHAVRPSNPAILHAFTQFARLTSALPNTHVVMVAGNHDTPRTAETGCILRLFSPLGVHVVEGEAQRVEFPEHGVSVLAVPDMPSGIPALTPDPEARYNVLLLHGEVAGMLPEHATRAERATQEISADELGAARWDYVALGHYHVYREVAPNAFYAGSLDYTSANPWGEIREEREARIYDGDEGGKGLIEWDLTTGSHTFHRLPVSRPLVDLPRLDGATMSASEIDAAIQDRVANSRVAIDDHVARLVVTNVSRHVARQLDQKAIRDLKRRALHFHLDIRRPEVVRRSASGAPGRRPSLGEVWREKLETRPLAADVEREAFVALGLHYLRRADAAMATPDTSVTT
ncbi:MAG TPA: DNA repair exonuclease [Candidatus Elarobacter sp.]|nr:DNA repair exonuclease [Candidatus Elarobacter sp.]